MQINQTAYAQAKYKFLYAARRYKKHPHSYNGERLFIATRRFNRLLDMMQIAKMQGV
jgi:hypothetical protein